MSKSKKRIPELRFPEFKNEGEWEVKKLEDLGQFIGGGTPERLNSNYWIGNIPWISSSDLKEDDIHNISTTRFINSSAIEQSATKRIPKGSVLFVSRVGVGKLAINTKELCTSQDFTSFVPSSKVSNFFIGYYFSSNKSLLQSLNQGTSIKGFSKNDLASLKLPFPESTAEQQKIASCLSSLDEAISAQSQKLDALKEYKKGLMQNLFPLEGEKAPKYRFKEFEKDGEWVKKELGELAEFSKGKGISKSDVVENGKSPCIRYGQLYTHYKETINDVISYTNVSAKELVLSKANDVIIPSSGETQEDIATASCVMKDGIALGGDLTIIRSNMSGVFLSYYLNNVKKKDIAQMAQGISVVHLYSSQLKNLNIKVPAKAEQQKIALCLSLLDELIKAHSDKIEQLKLHKKGLMQRLFPKMND